MLQAQFVREWLLRAGPDCFARRAYLSTLNQIWKNCCRSYKDMLLHDSLMSGSGMILVSPHLGFSKLMIPHFLDRLDDLRDIARIAVPNSEPWIWRHVAAYAMSKVWGRTDCFVPVEMMFDSPIAFLQKSYGAALVQSGGGGNVACLIQAIREGRFGRTPMLSMFPEGGTTGKRTPSLGCHALGRFHTGFVILARELDWPVVPVAHVVHSDGKSRVSVLKATKISRSSQPREMANQIRRRLQAEMTELLRIELTGRGSHCCLVKLQANEPTCSSKVQQPRRLAPDLIDPPRRP